MPATLDRTFGRWLVMQIALSRCCRWWLAVTTAAALVLLVLLLASCGSSTPSGNTSVPLPPGAAVGYWRPATDVEWPRLVCIRRIDGRYYLWLPSGVVRAPLVVEGNRLVHHIYADGKEISRSRLWVKPDGRLAFASFRRESSGTTVTFRLDGILHLTKATGSAAQLAAELHAWNASETTEKQVSILAKALGKWAEQHGGYPPREALLPGGAFWTWRGAPRLTNAVTGQPMVLGSGPGSLDYTSTGRWNWSVTGHMYGGGVVTGGGNP